jgi:hypothetical protein
MTVQQLIDELQYIDDKSRKIEIMICGCEHLPTDDTLVQINWPDDTYLRILEK